MFSHFAQQRYSLLAFVILYSSEVATRVTFVSLSGGLHLPSINFRSNGVDPIPLFCFVLLIFLISKIFENHFYLLFSEKNKDKQIFIDCLICKMILFFFIYSFIKIFSFIKFHLFKKLINEKICLIKF